MEPTSHFKITLPEPEIGKFIFNPEKPKEICYDYMMVATGTMVQKHGMCFQILESGINPEYVEIFSARYFALISMCELIAHDFGCPEELKNFCNFILEVANRTSMAYDKKIQTGH